MATRDAILAGVRAGGRYALSPPRQAPVGNVGTALSTRVGSSLEFRDFRDYQPGDDLRHIDWNAYARSDQLTIRLYREEVSPHLDVILDTSRSMALTDSRKAEFAAGLTALLATAASNAGHSHTAWLAGPEVRPLGNSSGPPVSWEEPAFDFAGDPGAGLSRIAAYRPRSQRILVSDLLFPAEPSQVVRALAERASRVVVVQVLAEADCSPPEGQSVRLTDVETGLVFDLFLDANVVRRYRASLARHQENWQRACRQLGAEFVPLIAERVLTKWSLGELIASEVLRVI